MTSRIRLWDRAGILLYEASAPAFREWVLNNIGSASFTLKALRLQRYIQYGKYVTIEHDTLGDWVGVISTPRPWSPYIVTVNAKSAMELFRLRSGSHEQPVSGSWGIVFSQLIARVNSAESTLLQMGDYFDGITYSSVVDMSNLYTYLQRALAQSQTRLDFRPEVVNGKLRIYVDMQPVLYTPSDLRLEEGLNIKNNSAILIEQGEIYNDITILGIGLQNEKFTAHAFDPESIEQYGLRQQLFSEGQSQSDVDRLAVVRLAQYKQPHKTFAFSVINKNNTFDLVRIGNAGQQELKSVGYYNNGLGTRGPAYIRVVQFDDKNGEAVLVTEEV